MCSNLSDNQIYILDKLYSYLTNEKEVLLILFNQLYCGKNNIKKVELTSDHKCLTLVVNDVDEINENVIEKKYIFNEKNFIVKKKKIKNYIKIKEDLTMIYYYKYIERKGKENILIINSVSNSQYNACLKLEKLIKNTNIKNKEKIAIL